MNIPLPLLAQLLLVIALAGSSVAAKTFEVATADELARALGAVQPGDEVVLRDGRYHGTFALANSGDAARPITIRAAHPQQAVFERTLFDLNGNHAVLTGFGFERSQVTLRGDFNRVGHCVFRFSDDRPAGMQAAVRTLGGASHNRIHHNEVTAWSTYGFRVMQITERTTGNRIDHNYLHDYENLRSSNEPEAIQINSSNPGSNLTVGTIIEHNLVERVKIRGELLSLKCSGNIVRANTFIDTQGSVQGRHGRDNAFLNNTLIGGGPLRAYGDNHRLIGNHLVGADLVVSVGSVLQDDLRLPNGAGGHPAARHQLVAANVVEGGGRIIVGKGLRSSSPFPVQDTTLAGNVGPLELDGPELEHTGSGRIRLRRNPGFVLLAERKEGECRSGVTYRLNVRKRGGEIVFAVDGRELGRINDPDPWGAGLLGLRTFRTELWWDNVRVRPLGVEGAR